MAGLTDGSNSVTIVTLQPTGMPLRISPAPALHLGFNASSRGTKDNSSAWFIRHWPSDREWSDWTQEENIMNQQRLFDAHEIAIHYQSTCSLNLAKYPKKQQKYIRMFLSLVKEGGYVCAHYPAIRRTLIGELKPADVKAIQCSDGFFCLKRIKLKRAKEVEGWRKMILLVASPRMGTMGRWKKIGSLLRIMVEHERIIPAFDLLPPWVQETACQEYMRRKHRMAYLLLPFGRTLADVDVAGITIDGKPIFSQVTLSTNGKSVREKAERLALYEGKKVFFCPKFADAEAIQQSYGSSIDFVWTDEVWKWLMSEKVYRRKLFTLL